MANKTNPIGVRFNKELLDKVATSPQKALNLYEETYLKKDEEHEKPPPNPEDELMKEKNEILKQIAEIKKEVIPELRNTTIGKKVWEMEQQNRINRLLNKLL